MKFIHTSDLHLGSKLTSNLDSLKAKDRRYEILHNFNRLLNDAKKQNASFIIIAGDLFDTEKITKQCFNEVLSQINSHSDLDIIYLVGNHEKTAFIDLIDVLPKNLKAVYQDTWQSFKYSDNGKDVVITCANITKSNNGLIYNTLFLNPLNTNIVVLHGQIANTKADDKAEIIDLRQLKNKNIDYLALGHYHFYDKGSLDDRGIYAYSGCLEGRGFDETGDKGYLLVDTDNVKEPDFIKFAKRTLYEILVDVTDYTCWTDIKNLVLDKVDDIGSENLVKVVLQGELDFNYNADTVLYVDELLKILNDRFYFAKVYNQVTIKINPLTYQNGNGIRGEFIKTVLSDGNLTDIDKNEIIQYGLKALKGDDL
jgi:DNA repair exonuclease SbcCD nuclease subunit